MNQNQAITVAMPVYNTGAYLHETISSVLAQTYTNFEFLILDDGSTDNSQEIIESFDDPRIRFIANEKNSGIIYSRNKLLQEAKHNWIALMDSDDLWNPLKLEIQMEALTQPENTGVVVLGTLGHYIGGRTGAIQYPTSIRDIRIRLLFDNCILQNSVILNNGWLKSHNLKYATEFPGAEDYALWVAILQQGGLIKNLEYDLVQYRVHGASESQHNKQLQEQSAGAIRRKAWQSLATLEAPEWALLSSLQLKGIHAVSTSDIQKLRDIGFKLIRAFPGIPQHTLNYEIARLLASSLPRPKNLSEKITIFVLLTRIIGITQTLKFTLHFLGGDTVYH